MVYWYKVDKELPGNPMKIGDHFHISSVPVDELEKWIAGSLISPVEGVIGPVNLANEFVKHPDKVDDGDD